MAGRRYFMGPNKLGPRFLSLRYFLRGRLNLTTDIGQNYTPGCPTATHWSSTISTGCSTEPLTSAPGRLPLGNSRAGYGNLTHLDCRNPAAESQATGLLQSANALILRFRWCSTRTRCLPKLNGLETAAWAVANLCACVIDL